MYFAQHSFTGASLLLHSLANQGVNKLFGCHGESLLPVFDQFIENTDIKFIQLKHEQAAVHAADGFSRASGTPGFALLGSGSSVTNAVTGIATAYSDSVPLVIIVCQIENEKIGKDSFQELDIVGLTMPITKQILKVNHVSAIPKLLEEAKEIAITGRPAPVVVEIPSNLLFEKATDFKYESGIVTTVKQKKTIPKHTLQQTIDAIYQAKKPIILVGGGTIISGASELLKELVEQTQIPVVSTLMGIGAFDSQHKLYLGMLGMHGTFAANKAVHHCDLLLCLGVRFSDRVTGKKSGFSPNSTKIHIDIDPSEINKIVHVDIPVVADIREFLLAIKEEVINVDEIKKNGMNWVQETTNYKKTVPRFEKVNSILKPQEVIRLIDHFSNDDSIVVTDVGQHQIFTAHHYLFTKPRTLLSSGGLGTMGFGLPAAIGAAIAMPSRHTICVTGDGSFQMNLQELHTVFIQKLPIKIVILNNGYLGMVRQWQELFYDRRYSSVKISSPDFAKLAEAYGIKGYKAKNTDEAEAIIQKAFANDHPALLEFDIHEEENVYPMVPPGGNNDEVILSR